MWGIVIGMALMFGVSLYRYKHEIVREQHPLGSARPALSGKPRFC